MPEPIENNFTMKIDKSCTIVVKDPKTVLEYELKDGEYSVLVFNDCKEGLNLKETGTISNSKVHICYLELNPYDLVQNAKINIMSKSELLIDSTYLGTMRKQVIFDLTNAESDSDVNIRNNIVCLDESDFSLDCIGNISKGAKRSKCHQKSHCLTIGNPKKARVLPVLNIDENDVEASHSLSSGTLDEEVLFYMNSRGLGKKDALNLILKSYLMPGKDFYSEFKDGEMIEAEAIGKVDEICSM